MRVLGYLILSSSLMLACGSSEDDSGGKGNTGGKDAGTGGSGATGGTGATGGGGSGGTGLTGGSGGSTGGTAGSTGGTAGASGGTAGASGGTAGASGGTAGASGGGGTAGAAAAKPECETAADCQLVNDCCNCEAIPNGATPPACGISNCFVTTCQPLGAAGKTPECVAGRCVVGFDCTSNVICATPPPACAAGTVPLIAAGCYPGSCVPADECSSVKSCADCTGDLACAIHAAQTQKAHCVEIPAACGNDASCACMGPSVCVDPFTSCNDLSGQKGVSCGCPVC